MKMKLAALIMLLAVFVMDRWIQDLNDTSPSVRGAATDDLGQISGRVFK